MVKGLRLGMICVAAALLGLAAFGHALVTVTHARNPELALKVDPDDPVALVRKAQADLAAKPDRRTADRAAAAARESIRGLALNPRAFQLLGLAAQDFEEIDTVTALLAFSARQSRRDLRTHLWLIEDEVRQNDVAGTLDLYDIALRSSPSSEALLFPVLTRALDEPNVRRHLLPYMKAPAPWMQAFLRTAVATTTRPQSIVAFVSEAGGFPEGPEYETFNAQLIRRLVDAGDHAAAISFYRDIGGQSEAVLTEAGMTIASTDPRFSPITWQPFTLDGIDASFVAAGQDQVQLDVDIESVYEGPVAHKLLRLPRGDYAFSAMHRSENPGPLSRINWQVRCEDAGDRTVVMSEVARLEPETDVRGTFSIGPACPAVVITLFAAAGVESGGVNFLVGPVEVTRR